MTTFMTYIFSLIIFLSCQKQDVQVLNHMQADLSSSNMAMDFGEQLLGYSYYQTLNITHTGDGFDAQNLEGTPFKTDSAFKYAGGLYPGTHGTCGNVLKAGESCIIEIEFNPRSE